MAAATVSNVLAWAVPMTITTMGSQLFKPLLTVCDYIHCDDNPSVGIAAISTQNVNAIQAIALSACNS